MVFHFLKLSAVGLFFVCTSLMAQMASSTTTEDNKHLWEFSGYTNFEDAWASDVEVDGFTFKITLGIYANGDTFLSTPRPLLDGDRNMVLTSWEYDKQTEKLTVFYDIFTTTTVSELATIAADGDKFISTYINKSSSKKTGSDSFTVKRPE